MGSWPGFAQEMKESLQRGVTFFELMVTAAILSIVLFVFLERVRGVQDLATEVSMEHVKSAIDTALQARAAGLVGNGRDAELIKLLDINPVELLQKPPAGYVGALNSPPPVAEHWRWYFDLNEKCIVFLLNNGNSVATGRQKVLKYKVKLKYSPLLPRYQEAAIAGIALEPIQ